MWSVSLNAIMAIKQYSFKTLSRTIQYYMIMNIIFRKKNNNNSMIFQKKIGFTSLYFKVVYIKYHLYLNYHSVFAVEVFSNTKNNRVCCSSTFDKFLPVHFSSIMCISCIYIGKFKKNLMCSRIYSMFYYNERHWVIK